MCMLQAGMTKLRNNKCRRRKLLEESGALFDYILLCWILGVLADEFFNRVEIKIMYASTESRQKIVEYAAS